MNVRVRVLDTTHVRPELPGHAATINLSPFDTLFLALPPIQRIFFYDDDGAPSVPPFPAIIRSLQASLAATLSVFAPLAGRLAACPGGDLVVDCSPDALRHGVRFVQAEYSGDAADVRRLARDAEHDTEAFVQLVPELEVGRLPAPLLAVQLTRPALSGGDDQRGPGAVVVGVSMHHAVADGQSLFQFMRAWAAASREGSPAAAGLVPPPTFDRAGIMRHPKAEAAARNFARLCAPDLPMVNTCSELDWTRQSRRTYLLDAGQIQSLKRRIVQQRQAAGTDDDNQPPPSTYVAVASLLWTSMARAKHPDDADNAGDDGAYLLFPADCRCRLRPPLDPGFFGNCVKLCFARATASKLGWRDNDDDGALAHAAGALQRAIREQVEEKDPLGDADRWAETYQGIPPERRSQQGSSHRFMAYEVDFGWGQPSRAEIVSMFSPEVAMLVGGPHGAVQVSVALGRDLIDGFEVCFRSLLSA
ncbi:hypothetical protein CFC21_107279 [Triticum aestivum]|uniref:Anthocyanin 5-aromatic acyltransferase n=2 Tax=Triticum aestivum TaxID=4565 RepID=A0A3B6TJ47_WHEAT|nr:anthocyanin 5-aromatic acyltransferase-like [Triticum aestivum]KAF7106559.1 hypothetical protein CFC21_107279 [Triticum aestivum]